MSLIYYAYDWQQRLLAPLRALAGNGATIAEGWPQGPGSMGLGFFQATCHLMNHCVVTHERPDFAIREIDVDGALVAIEEEVVTATPFCSLVRFRQKGAPRQPRLLVAAPLSGHFATLLIATVRTLLRDHEVYLTDWHNMRDVPVSAGAFGLDDYVEHLIQFQRWLGPGAHLLAVCQPCVPALAAVAVMAAQGDPAQPLSMTLMAGPIDTRINPTKVNELAVSKSIDWFKTNLITTVPWPYSGVGRAVYPGFLQLTAFMSMQPQRHLKAHRELFDHLTFGRAEKAHAIAEFYKEYFAVLDMSAEFYLETVERVFQKAELAMGEFTYRGQRVDPGRIGKTALLTVEGERDDICAPGQTLAAHDLCTGLRPYRKRHHLQAGVGHYGVFSGRRWDTQVYPIVQNFILSMDDFRPLTVAMAADLTRP